MIRFAFISGTAGGFLAVALGAFGAHALKARLTPALLEVWETAVKYQLYHALALVLVALWMRQVGTSSAVVVWCFVAGMVVFSGSLYLRVLLDIKLFGAITPVGGVLLLIGWLVWLIQGARIYAG